MPRRFLTHHRFVSVCSLLAISALSLSGVTSSAGAAPTTTQNWSPVGSLATAPSSRYDASMVYDAATNSTVLFGGYDGSSLGETWTWNGSAWAKQSPTTSPSPRRGASMVYDAATQQVVLFGGTGSGGALNDTWTWNGTTWTQQLASAPSPRTGAAMAYDESTHDVVLFGGRSVNGLESDTWLWNGTSWTLLTMTTPLPAPRYQASMVYDAATHDVVLFGGDGSSGAVGNTWTWDGTTWTNERAAGPPARYGAAMIYDSTTSDVILFGGFDGTNASAATWVWNGRYWTQLASTTAPSARYESTMSYDAVNNNAVLFGGFDGTNALSDTWSFVVAPSAPVKVRATSNANTQSVVTWIAPTSNGGSALTGYSLVAKDLTVARRGGQTCTTTGLTTCTVAGLTNGDQYVITVSATNAVGTGNGASSNVVRPATAPGAPTITKLVPGSDQATVYWTTPASTGGTPVASYRVTAAPGGAFCHVPRSMTSCRIPGLTNGDGYIFTMTATNAAGTGPISASAAVVLPNVRPRTLPSAPIITSTSVVGNAITVRWRVPVSNGGVRLNGYNIYVGSVSGGESVRPLASVPFTRFSFTFFASVGHREYVYLRAVNVVGTGPHSNQFGATAR